MVEGVDVDGDGAEMGLPDSGGLGGKVGSLEDELGRVGEGAVDLGIAITSISVIILIQK